MYKSIVWSKSIKRTLLKFECLNEFGKIEIPSPLDTRFKIIPPKSDSMLILGSNPN